MTLLRNLKMFSFRVSYTCRNWQDDELGKRVPKDYYYDKVHKVVTTYAEIAEAFLRKRNGGPEVQGYSDFKVEFIEVEEAPDILIPAAP